MCFGGKHPVDIHLEAQRDNLVPKLFGAFGLPGSVTTVVMEKLCQDWFHFNEAWRAEEEKLHKAVEASVHAFISLPSQSHATPDPDPDALAE